MGAEDVDYGVAACGDGRGGDGESVGEGSDEEGGRGI